MAGGGEIEIIYESVFNKGFHLSNHDSNNSFAIGLFIRCLFRAIMQVYGFREIMEVGDVEAS